MKPRQKSKGPGSKRFKLKYYNLLFKFCFQFLLAPLQPGLDGARRVPPLLLSNLFADVGDLMTETFSGCGLVLGWQHRQLRVAAGVGHIPPTYPLYTPNITPAYPL